MASMTAAFDKRSSGDAVIRPTSPSVVFACGAAMAVAAWCDQATAQILNPLGYWQ